MYSTETPLVAQHVTKKRPYVAGDRTSPHSTVGVYTQLISRSAEQQAIEHMTATDRVRGRAAARRNWAE